MELSDLGPGAQPPHVPPVIGLVGGVAAGKSFVAKQFGRFGAAVLAADQVGHEVLCEPAIERAARDRWGSEIFGPDGHIARPALARLVFNSSPEGARELAYLEQLTHPKIGERLQAELDSLRHTIEIPAIILDAAVMFRAGWNRFCNLIVYVDAPREVRLNRARSRGWSQEDFDRREAAQESLDAKRVRADLVIDAAGSLESTVSQVADIWRSVVGSSPPQMPI